ncbi:hypothetical protein EAH_00041670 [Eimeria acervulina]|uniref:Uncharacterized protein n=1 Tax=Eimeria acervulina TaxID=5801 RepID=U6GI89_EIMAC|nr:hypothetical protein EAH_00041670 [Eimeria acervulina]CDI79277.1 hypothetical protein EAH_00041670 [Eimeria acervulina]
MPTGSATGLTTPVPKVPESQPDDAPPSPSSPIASSTPTHPQFSSPGQDASPPPRSALTASGPAQPPATPPSRRVESSPSGTPPSVSGVYPASLPTNSKGPPPEIPPVVEEAPTTAPMPTKSATGLPTPPSEVPGGSPPSPPMSGRWNDNLLELTLTLSGTSPQAPCSEDRLEIGDLSPVLGSMPRTLPWKVLLSSADSSGVAVSEKDEQPPVPENVLDSGDDGNSKDDHLAEPPSPRREGGQQQPGDSSPSGEPFPPPGGQPTPPGEDPPPPERPPFPKREPHDKKVLKTQEEAEALIEQLKMFLTTGESVASSVGSDCTLLDKAEGLFSEGMRLSAQAQVVLPLPGIDNGILKELHSLTGRCDEVCVSLKSSSTRWQRKLRGFTGVFEYYRGKLDEGMQSAGPPGWSFMLGLEGLLKSAKEARALLKALGSLTGPFKMPPELRGIHETLEETVDDAEKHLSLAAGSCASAHLQALTACRHAAPGDPKADFSPNNPTLLAAASTYTQLKATGYRGDALRDLGNAIDDCLGLSGIL